MKKRLIVLSSLVAVGAPLWVFAQGAVDMCAGSITPIQGVLCTIRDIMNTIIPILIVLGVIYFIWGIVQYMIGGDEEAKKKGRDKIIYGLIGLVVIVAMWGLVGLITRTFGINNNPAGIQAPCVPGTNSGC